MRPIEHTRDALLRHKTHDLLPVLKRQLVADEEQRIGAARGHGGEDPLEVRRPAHLAGLNKDPECPAGVLNFRGATRTGASLSGHELMVCAFRDVVPRADERLELRERRVDLSGHGALLGLFPDDVGRQLLEIAQHGCR